MEYQYRHDPTTGQARAIFSLEHEIFGPWLEVELGNNIDKFTDVMTAIDQVQQGKVIEKIVTGHEYSVVIDQDDVHIHPNVDLNGGINGNEGLPEEFSEQGFILENNMASCGLEDFRDLLVAWSQFIKLS